MKISPAAMDLARKLHADQDVHYDVTGTDFESGECKVADCTWIDHMAEVLTEFTEEALHTAEADRQTDFPCGCIVRIDTWIEPICESHRTGVARVVAAEVAMASTADFLNTGWDGKPETRH